MPTTPRRAAAHYARRNRRGRQDPMAGLFWTHNLGIEDAAVDTDVVFPDRTRPVTFGTRIAITGASASGIVFSFGGATNGTKLAISGGSLYVAAGDAIPVTATGVDGSVALDSLGEIGAILDLVVAIRPRSGELRVWVNGTIQIRLDSAAATAMLDNQWADSDDGAVGAAPALGSTQRIGAAVNTAPSDFALTLPLRVAMGMTPRQFDA